MIISQISPLTFGPNPIITPISIIDSPGSISNLTNSGVIFEQQIPTSFHYDYNIEGLGITTSQISYSSVPIDDSLFPLLKRQSSAKAKIRLSNDRGVTSDIYLDFLNKGGGTTTYSNPKSLVNGSYAKYSWDRIHAIFSQLDDGTPDNHRVFDENQLRRKTSIIPHQALTGHIAGQAGTINNSGGHLRMFAITPRHCVQIAHSGAAEPIGWPIRFRDVNNNIITKTTIGNFNIKMRYGELSPSPYGGPDDLRIFVLDSDLPESITPAPFVGDWFMNYVGTSTAGTFNPGAFGFVSFNQDTHICPTQMVNPLAYNYNTNYSLTLNSTLIEGREFSLNHISNPTLISLEGYERWNYYVHAGVVGGWYPDRPFFHAVRPGDSGSPIYWPVGNDGWAVGYGMIHGSMWRPAAMNALLAEINDIMGITETYEVTVAPDPTL